MSACVGRWRNRRIDVPRYWNGEREDERALRERLGSWGHKAACVAYGALQVIGLLFAFVSVAVVMAVLCAFVEG